MPKQEAEARGSGSAGVGGGDAGVLAGAEEGPPLESGGFAGSHLAAQ